MSVIGALCAFLALLTAGVLTFTPIGLGSLALAVLFAAFFLVAFWAYRGHRSGVRR